MCDKAKLVGGGDGGGGEGWNWATENFAARAANLAWKCLATNHSGGKRQTDRKTMRQMSEGERDRERESVC